MPNQQPTISDVSGRRNFVCSPAAVAAFIVDAQERILMLSNPKRPGKWEVVNGALDAEETILEAVLRETCEEAGDQIQVRPLGTIHTYTFRYDDNVQYMITTAYLLAYGGGAVIPGDDMAGSEARWFTLDEIESGALQIIVPQTQHWMFRHAIELYRMLKDRPAVELQTMFDANTRNKYALD